MAIKKPEKKISVDELRENHLAGPAEESIDEMRKELKEDYIVIASGNPQFEKVVFRNQRDPGHVLEFHYHSKTSPFKQYKLIDGHQYELPVEVIKNLESCRENVEKYRRNADGIPEIYVAGYKTHFVCERV